MESVTGDQLFEEHQIEGYKAFKCSLRLSQNQNPLCSHEELNEKSPAPYINYGKFIPNMCNQTLSENICRFL